MSTSTLLNPLEKRALAQLGAHKKRDHAFARVGPLLLVAAMVLVLAGTVLLVAGYEDWAAAQTSGEYSMPPGLVVLYVGGIAALLGVAASLQGRERQVLRSALRKIQGSGKTP